jgi:hypothetical protein
VAKSSKRSTRKLSTLKAKKVAKGKGKMNADNVRGGAKSNLARPDKW